MSAAQQILPQLSHPRPSPQPSPRGSERGLPFSADALDRTIGLDILLLPGFDLLDLATAEEVAATVTRGPPRYRVDIAVRSVCDAPVRASCGVKVAPAPCRAPARNLLVLGGAVHAPGQYAPWQFRLRREAYESARVLCAGGGIFALAATGLLDGQTVAAPWRSAAAWRALAPKVRFVRADWMEGSKFHSALGGRALARFLLQCIARQFDAATAGEIALALNMEFDPRRPPAARGQDRLPPRCPPALRAAIRAMHGSLDRSLEIGEICAANNVSERTLQRLFRRNLRTTIGAYHRACRLEHARELLRLTPLSVIEVALTAGFESPTHFSQSYRRHSQSYRRHFGCTPRQDR
jgi:AraC family transcriptional regulator, glycine betaine-responsive activator